LEEILRLAYTIGLLVAKHFNQASTDNQKEGGMGWFPSIAFPALPSSLHFNKFLLEFKRRWL